MWDVVFHPQAEKELDRLASVDRVAVLNAVEKLKALGPRLPFPHQSHVEGASGIRELRPRAGRSRWRALYGRIGAVFVIVAIGPEAHVDPHRFRRAVTAATRRLAKIEQ